MSLVVEGGVASTLEKAGVSNLYIFGSAARGEDDLGSDIDLLVEFNLDNGLLPIMRLNEALSLLLQEKVEISPRETLRLEVLADALADAVPL